VSTRTQLSSTPPVRLLLGGLLAALLGVVVLVTFRPAPADAAVRVVEGSKYGVQREDAEPPAEPPFTPLSYGGGPVVHSTAPYAIFWDPKTTMGGWEGLIEGYLEGAGRESGVLTNVFDVASQYGDASGKAAYSMNFRGGFTDVDPFPGTFNCSEAAPCVTDAQIRTELAKYINANGLPTGLNPVTGATPIYFLFTPPDATVCLEGAAASGHCSKAGVGEPLCSYHSFTTVSSATVLYAVVPGTPRTGCQDGKGQIQVPNKTLADVIVNEVAAEQVATVTDPLLTGWHDTGGEQNEAPDKCRNSFTGGLFELAPPEDFNQFIAGVKYYVNNEFDQAALYDGFPGEPCLNEVKQEPRFTSPNPVHSGDLVTFNASQSVVDLGVAKYNWSFGDGTSTEVNCEGRVPTSGFIPAACNGSSGTGNPNSVASVVHHYTYGGVYDVTLTLIDDGGNPASVTHEVTVSGPAPPSPSSGAATSSSGTGSSSSSSSSRSSNNTAKPPPAKVLATQSIVSRSLSSVAKGGLVIRYSVSEQVAGRFEVLLASSIAHKLGLKGASAAGLAKGTPAQTIIAKAILVTTKGGEGTYKIKFSKATASRLRKLPKVSLMIRMVVHNAASPAVTTVLDTVNLAR
jgi:hypothetical protein